MATLTLQELLLAGTHFGHLTRRWNPKMKKFIFMERSGIYIIDLKKTLHCLEVARQAMADVVRAGDKVLFVGTRRQVRDIVRSEAERCGQYFINDRWLGGTLTNFTTIKKSIRTLKSLTKKEVDGTYDALSKKEILDIERAKLKLRRVLGGVEEMTRLPGMLYLVDTIKDSIAVQEAHKLRIPIVAIVDTNCDPQKVNFPIPGNDDALKSVSLITKIMADMVIETTMSTEAAASEEPAEAEAGVGA